MDYREKRFVSATTYAKFVSRYYMALVTTSNIVMFIWL